jgi:hypothetical protein
MEPVTTTIPSLRMSGSRRVAADGFVAVSVPASGAASVMELHYTV